MVIKERIIEELETILDPEVHVDIWTMGLIYDITIREKEVDILMTYTTPFCPAGPILQDQIRDGIISLGFEKVNIEVTFDPPWQMPEGLRAMMGV